MASESYILLCATTINTMAKDSHLSKNADGEDEDDYTIMSIMQVN